MRQTLLIAILCSFFCSFKDKEPFGVYKEVNEVFSLTLKLNPDSTFEYDFSCKQGSTSSKGKWILLKDTLYLSNYEKPCTIRKFEEKRIDSLGNNSILEIITNDSIPLIAVDSPSINIRGARDFYVDGTPTKIKYDTKTQRNVIANFEVWINDECNNRQSTDKTGRIKFQNKVIHRISFLYDDCLIKDKRSNYFVLTLSNFPLFMIISPPTLTWAKWVFSDETLIPIECNEQPNYMKLKKYHQH